jgi:hypothetical protein
MTMLEIDLKLNTNLGAHKIMHPLTKDENFRCISKEYELYACDRRAARSEKLPRMSFRHTYSTC